MNAIQIQNDTLSILLTSRVHQGLDIKSRSIKIAKCCKKIRDKTKDNVLYDACRKIITATSVGKYDKVIQAVTMAELKYLEEYRR